MTHQSAINNVAYYHTSTSYYSLQSFHQRSKMRGAQRVITFCLLTAVLPTILLIIPLYLRHIIFADVTFAVAESDVIEIVDGVSSIFCQEHSLKMNSSFQAFQVNGKPQLSSNRKHIRLKKSMTLPDDTLEYWGFYLLKGSTVVLSVCSRYDGSRILVVKGERNLRTCGLMDHSVKHKEAHMADGHGQVRVTFETDAQEIRSDSIDNPSHYTPVNHTNEPKTQPIKLPTKRTVVKNDFNEQYEGEVTSKEKVDVKDNKLEQLDEFNVTDHVPSSYLSDNVMYQRMDSSSNQTHPNTTRKHRHAKHRMRDLKIQTTSGRTDSNKTADEVSRKKFRTTLLEESLKQTSTDNASKVRVKRRNVNVPVDHILDGGIGHGHGGSVNETVFDDIESSVSSFENSLLSCYDGQILLVQGFPPSQNCTSVKDVEINHIMKTSHEVVSDGYYYYIFYSDNDFLENHIHAIFDIRKPTYQYTDHTRGCINKTMCTFPVSFWSDDTVIVEVPTRDGIEHEDDDITLLVSSCNPRMAIYIIFPILVLFSILGCAFL